MNIRGINSFTKRRTDGTIERFVYAWRGPGAPRLFATPGTPEFEAEYERACQSRQDALRKEATRLEQRFVEQFAPPMLRKAHNRSAKKNVSSDLTIASLEALYREQLGCCAVSGLPFDLDDRHRAGCHFNPYAPSLDRIDSRRGYVLENIRLVLFAVNAALNQWGLETYLKISSAACGKAFAKQPISP